MNFRVFVNGVELEGVTEIGLPPLQPRSYMGSADKVIIREIEVEQLAPAIPKALPTPPTLNDDHENIVC